MDFTPQHVNLVLNRLTGDRWTFHAKLRPATCYRHSMRRDLWLCATTIAVLHSFALIDSLVFCYSERCVRITCRVTFARLVLELLLPFILFQNALFSWMDVCFLSLSASNIRTSCKSRLRLVETNLLLHYFSLHLTTRLRRWFFGGKLNSEFHNIRLIFYVILSNIVFINMCSYCAVDDCYVL